MPRPAVERPCKGKVRKVGTLYYIMNTRPLFGLWLVGTAKDGQRAVGTVAGCQLFIWYPHIVRSEQLGAQPVAST
jgi:hypothetical protein